MSVRHPLGAAAVCVGTALLLTAASPAWSQRAATPPQKQPTFDELYRQGQQMNAGIKTLTARFTETTSHVLLEKPIEESGALYVQRPSNVALRYDGPDEKTVVIAGNRLTTTVRGAVVQRLDIGATQNRVQRYFVEGDASELRRAFDIVLHDTSGRPGTRALTMTPKRRQIREALSQLDLWVNESTALLEAMRITFTSGQIKFMEFSEVMTNVPVDPAVFTAPK